MSEKIDFENTLLMLDEIVKKLESGNMSLDESINAFEEAVKLIGVCNKHLENAERRVRLLTEGADGSITDVPFDICDET